jgi:hypothetical protein
LRTCTCGCYLTRSVLSTLIDDTMFVQCCIQMQPSARPTLAQSCCRAPSYQRSSACCRLTTARHTWCQRVKAARCSACQTLLRRWRWRMLTAERRCIANGPLMVRQPFSLCQCLYAAAASARFFLLRSTRMLGGTRAIHNGMAARAWQRVMLQCRTVHLPRDVGTNAARGDAALAWRLAAGATAGWP